MFSFFFLVNPASPQAGKFKDAFTAAQKEMTALKDGADAAPDAATDEAAAALDALKTSGDETPAAEAEK